MSVHPNHCAFCHGTKKTESIVHTTVTTRVPCSQLNDCYHGRYAINHRACGGQGCAECSTQEQHGIVGKCLCRECAGRGVFEGRQCDKCKGTGVYAPHVCRHCGGSRVTTETTRMPDRKIESACMFCGPDTRLYKQLESALGNLNEAALRQLLTRQTAVEPA